MGTIEYLRLLRVGPFTVFDTVTAYLGVIVLSPILSWLAARVQLKIPLSSWLCFTLPLSVVFHIIFHQSTPLMKILADPGKVQFYLVICTLLAMTYAGFRKISRIR